MAVDGRGRGATEDAQDKPSSRPSRTPTRSFISSPSTTHKLAPTSVHQVRASSRSSKEAQLKAMELEKQKKAKLERAYELCLPTARPPNLKEADSRGALQCYTPPPLLVMGLPTKLWSSVSLPRTCSPRQGAPTARKRQLM